LQQTDLTLSEYGIDFSQTNYSIKSSRIIHQNRLWDKLVKELRSCQGFLIFDKYLDFNNIFEGLCNICLQCTPWICSCQLCLKVKKTFLFLFQKLHFLNKYDPVFDAFLMSPKILFYVDQFKISYEMSHFPLFCYLHSCNYFSAASCFFTIQLIDTTRNRKSLQSKVTVCIMQWDILHSLHI